MSEYIYEIEEDQTDESEIFIGWIRRHSKRLIRCKDCIHWHDGYCMSPDVYVADQEYMTGDLRTEATHYCGYAEREE